MHRIYFDNAATTPVSPEVVEVMTKAMTENFGNPSSIHAFGRQSRVLIEEARKTVAGCIGASIGDVFFTSCGTESNNMVLKGAVRDLGVQRIITSPTEHPCVLNPVKILEQHEGTQVDFVKVDEKGRVQLAHLEALLKDSKKKTLVSLMHANNEIGT